MKKISLTFVLVFSFLWVAAQFDDTTQLKLQLKEHPQQDTFRVNRLIKLSMARVNNPDRNAADEALIISRKIGYVKGEGFALTKLGRYLSAQGSTSEARKFVEQGAEIAVKVGDNDLSAYSFSTLAALSRAESNSNTALVYYAKAVAAAEKSSDKRELTVIQENISLFYANVLSNYPKAMEWALKTNKTAEDINCKPCLVQSWFVIGLVYTDIGDNENALMYDKKALEGNKSIGDTHVEFDILTGLGERYRLMGNYPAAIKAYNDAMANYKSPFAIGLDQSNLADVYVRLNNLPLAFKYGFSALNIEEKRDDDISVSWVDGILARAYSKKNMPDSALYYANIGFAKATKSGTLEFMRDNTGALANAYAQKGDYANAYKFHKLYIGYRDSMINTQVTNQANLLRYNFDLQKKQAQIALLAQQQKQQQYFLIAAAIMIGLIVLTVIILLRNNRQKQKANNLLSKQKQIIEQQRDETNKALADLKLTQTQLIQSEKMASLGELTAGIAHEIQNPLNFVNNFSEVNTELIDEMQEEIDKGNYTEVKTIAKDVKENQQKINMHGKRADFIVKGMLEHSRSNTGEKQLTNINVLADEFLKLSYHGLRAKDKSFNAEMITHFDNNLPKVSIAQQDIGRVLLNLFNNAFYAVNQKQKTAGDGYKPEVTITTSAEKNNLVITVKDNGNGIPKENIDKIYQPFFTTKPTGEGTGLGLSLSYDIIVKGHGGSITVDTKENEFTEFTIILPLNQA